MDEKIDKAIESLLSMFKTGTNPKSEDAQRLSQSVLNLAHAKQILDGKPKKPTS